MRLNQVTRHCLELERSLKFYRQLGLEMIVYSANHYARLACPDGESTFSLHQSEMTAADPHSVIYFECDELDATVARLQQEGLVFDSPPQDQPWLWREAYLRDPDGHPVCLYFAGDNRLNPPWRISETAMG
mgnify:CR=1 FL=1